MGNKQCRSAQRIGSSTGGNIVAANHGAMRHSGRCLAVVTRGSGQYSDQKHEMVEMPFVRPPEIVVPLSDGSGETRARFRIHWAVKEELVNAMADLSYRVQYYQGMPTLCSGATTCSHARPKSRAVSAPCPPPEHMTTRSWPGRPGVPFLFAAPAKFDAGLGQDHMERARIKHVHKISVETVM